MSTSDNLGEKVSDKTRWDRRYAEGAYSQRSHPSDYLADNIDLLKGMPGRSAADLACGRGRNSWFLADHGFKVDAYDVSSVGLQQAQGVGVARDSQTLPGDAITWMQQDLLKDGLPEGRCYDVVLMVRFVALELLSTIPARLNPGGFVLVEEHLVMAGGNYGELAGPGSDRFRVQSGALMQTLDGLEIVHSFEGVVSEPDGANAAVARIIARKQT